MLKQHRLLVDIITNIVIFGHSALAKARITSALKRPETAIQAPTGYLADRPGKTAHAALVAATGPEKEANL